MHIAGTVTGIDDIQTMSEVLNANPIIRSASDLPSRRRQGKSQPSSKTPKGLFASIAPPSAYAPDPFSPLTSSDSDLSDEEDGIEPIDEQEVYGKDDPSRRIRLPVIQLETRTICVKIDPTPTIQLWTLADLHRSYLTDFRP